MYSSFWFYAIIFGWSIVYIEWPFFLVNTSDALYNISLGASMFVKVPDQGFPVLKAGADPGFLERGFICICMRVRFGDFI